VTFAVLVALAVLANPLFSRAGVLSLGALSLASWNAAVAEAALDGEALLQSLALESLLVVGWTLVLISIGRALSPRWPASLVRSALVGALVVAGSSFALQGLTPAASASVGVSAGALWLLGEITRDARGIASVARRAWLRFAACAALFLILSAASTFAQFAPLGTAAADSLLFGRALASLAAAPALVLLCARREALSVGVFVSRHALAAALVSAAVLAVALSSALLFYRLLDGSGAAVQLTLSAAIAGSIGALLLVLAGPKRVDWVRVQLSKHFYRFKYDYREEWLRLTNTLASTSGDLTLPKRAIKGLADIVASKAGALFVLDRDSQTYVAAASWNTEIFKPLEEHRRDHLIAFMEKHSWIVDSKEYKTAVPKAALSFLDDFLTRTDRELLVVPLLIGTELFGFVVLERPAALRRLSYEDIDILRTGGREAAGHLGQYYLAQRLAEAKQFEDFGRMTAFLVHDLTNISAQQSLILHNSERHKSNAQFIDDAMRTISGSVDRINRLVALVRSGLRRSEPRPVEAAAVIREAVRLCASYAPHPVVTFADETLLVLIEADRFSHGLAHLIRNSQQAATETGRVTVSLDSEADQAVIKVTDNGSGMSADFVHERLFRPFDSTKPGTALGIGAFQIKDVIKASGGTLNVQTAEGVGSSFIIRLPLLSSKSLASAAEA
jgi:putative PEP-CTERM system histidine kinase